jgi:hypothetical protein
MAARTRTHHTKRAVSRINQVEPKRLVYPIILVLDGGGDLSKRLAINIRD